MRALFLIIVMEMVVFGEHRALSKTRQFNHLFLSFVVFIYRGDSENATQAKANGEIIAKTWIVCVSGHPCGEPCQFPTLLIISYDVMESSHCLKNAILSIESSSGKALEPEEEEGS